MSHHDAKRRLIKRLRELGVRLSDIEGALEEPSSKDWEESAVEREGDEVLEALGEAGQAEIARINAALARISAGTFGECAKCGDAISSARLAAVPDAPLCVKCAG